MIDSIISDTAIRINDWLAKQGGPIITMFDHSHLELPPLHFSTYIEGWYVGEQYGMQAVSEAIQDGSILLPPNVAHEMYSHCEMYFYIVDNASPCIYSTREDCIVHEIVDTLAMYGIHEESYDISWFADDYVELIDTPHAHGYRATFKPHEIISLIKPYGAI